MLTDPCCSSVESKLTVAELEWPCMTAQSWGCIASCTCDSVQTLPCLVSFHSLFSFTGAAQSTISWVLLSESDFKTADQHWAVHHNFTSPSHFLSSVSTHLSVPYQLVSASRLGTTWLPTRWCHLLATSSNALLMMWMLMNAVFSTFPRAK